MHKLCQHVALSCNMLTILVPRGCGPFDQHKESRPLGRYNFLSISREFVSYSQPIRFVRFALSMRRVTRSLWFADFWYWTFLEVAILGADQKECGLWGWEWMFTCMQSNFLVNFGLSVANFLNSDFSTTYFAEKLQKLRKVLQWATKKQTHLTKIGFIQDHTVHNVLL